MSQQRLNTPEEEAKRLKVSARTLAKWRCVGSPNIPYIKIGRAVRYDPLKTDAYLAKHSVNMSEAAND
jgi:hypothetical protein